MTSKIFSLRLNCDRTLCPIAALLVVFSASACGFPRLPWMHSRRTSVHQAAERGDAAELAKTMVNNPAAANALDAKANTPLHLSAGQNRIEAAGVLLRSGAEVSARNAEGMTPLMVAAKSGSLEVVKLLLSHGADSTLKDAHGSTALKWAKRNRHYEIAMRIALSAARR